MRYFQQFPIITYNAQRVRDITRRVKVLERAKKYTTLFYPYTIKDGQRPDTIARDYYGNSYYFWVIFLVNDIVDPYYDWPLTQSEFDRMIIKEYGSINEAQDEIVFYEKQETNWYGLKSDHSTVLTEDEWTALPNISKQNYELILGDDVVRVSIETYEGMEAEDQADYEPVYAYNHEFDLNENKRQIKLLDLKYLPLIEEDFVKKMRKK